MACRRIGSSAISRARSRERNAILRELAPPMQRENLGPIIPLAGRHRRLAPHAVGDAHELSTQRLETRRCIPGLCVHRGPDGLSEGHTHESAYEALKAQFTEGATARGE